MRKHATHLRKQNTLKCVACFRAITKYFKENFPMFQTNRIFVSYFKHILFAPALLLAVTTAVFAQFGGGNSPLLDPAFSGNGKVVTADNNLIEANAVVQQPAGEQIKIVVVGSRSNGANSDFAVVRYNNDGSIDTTFGTNGYTFVDFGGGSDVANAVVIQNAGNKIIVVGTSGSPDKIALTRLNADGSIDTTFGTGGKVTTLLNAAAEGNAVTLNQFTSKIIVAGTTRENFTYKFLVAQYNLADGSVDTTFGTNGSVTTQIGSFAIARSIVITIVNKIVIGGSGVNSESSDFTLARYTSDGVLDSTFGTNGITTTNFQPSQNGNSASEDRILSITLDQQQRIVAAGDSRVGNDVEWAIARYTSEGVLDNNFNEDGLDLPSIGGGAQAVALQPDGNIVVGGDASFFFSPSDFTLLRYKSLNGTTDETFGGGGQASADFGEGTSSRVNGLTIQTDGKIMAVGATDATSLAGGSSNFVLARFLPILSSAANVTVSGRVTNSGGGVSNILVNFTDLQGEMRGTRTNQFGYLRFEEVAAGQTYVFQVISRKYRFAPQVITITEDLTDLNFTTDN